MRKRVLFLLICCLFACTLMTGAQALPELTSKAACVLEVKTGRVLYAKDAELRLPMASTTKVMTALMVIEAGNLDKVVTIPEQAVGVEGSSVYLKKGEQFTRKSLLYALMLESGNDVSVALAVDQAGSVNDFVSRMNARARELGATNTNFANPHGLPNNSHYTTAYDLALITAAALRNPVFCEIVSTKSIVIKPQTEGTARSLSNHNKLLWQMQGACGVKTGYTKAAGRCLVGAVNRDGKRVVAVVLNAPDMWEDMCALLEDSLKNLKLYTLKQGGEALGTVKVKGGLVNTVDGILSKDITVTVTEEELTRVKLQVEIPQSIAAPITEGDVIGHVTVYLDANCLETVDILADRNILENTFDYQLNRLLKIWIGNGNLP